jgi:hypothetical protein
MKTELELFFFLAGILLLLGVMFFGPRLLGPEATVEKMELHEVQPQGTDGT